MLGEGSASDSNSSGSVTPQSQQQAKIKSYEAYFIYSKVRSLLCISVDFRYLSQMPLTWSQLTINVFYELHVFMWVVHFYGQKLLWHAFDTENITLYLHNCLIQVENMVPVCPSLLLTIFTANHSHFMQTICPLLPSVCFINIRIIEPF